MSNAIGDLVEENYKLKEEIERLCNALNEVIERNSKAIEYINTLDYENEETYDIGEYVRNELLDILQGSDN